MKDLAECGALKCAGHSVVPQGPGTLRSVESLEWNLRHWGGGFQVRNLQGPGAPAHAKNRGRDTHLKDFGVLGSQKGNLKRAVWSAEKTAETAEPE